MSLTELTSDILQIISLTEQPKLVFDPPEVLFKISPLLPLPTTTQTPEQSGPYDPYTLNENAQEKNEIHEIEQLSGRQISPESKESKEPSAYYSHDTAHSNSTYTTSPLMDSNPIKHPTIGYEKPDAKKTAQFQFTQAQLTRVAGVPPYKNLKRFVRRTGVTFTVDTNPDSAICILSFTGPESAVKDITRKIQRRLQNYR